jgi:hypothetical protein
MKLLTRQSRQQLRVAEAEVTAITARCAFDWMRRLRDSSDPRESVEFLAWAKQSPLHIREVLFAVSFDALLDEVLRGANVDVAPLMKLAATNVVPFHVDDQSEIVLQGKDVAYVWWRRARRTVSIVVVITIICIVLAASLGR